MRMLGRLERYVMTRTLAMVGAALSVIALIVLLIDFVELSRDVGQRADTGFAVVLGLTLMKSPTTILVLLPFVFLFGVQFAFVRLNRSSELVAMRAAGVSAWRFIFPAAAAAFLIGLLVVTVISPGAALLAQRFEATRSGALESVAGANQDAVWLRQGDSRTQVVIRAQSRRGGVLNDVSMFVYNVDEDGAPRFARRIEAREARLVEGEWRLVGVRDATPGDVAVSSESGSLSSTLDPRSALDRQAAPEAVPFWRLPRVIAQTEQAGFSATRYRLRFQELLATPLTYAAMAILAAAFSLRLLRLGGLAQLAGAGVLLGFLFFFFAQLCGALGKADIIAAVFAAWIPPVLAVLAGLTLLFNTEDG
jgi:lipopolysaccharide export system permease protein